MSNNYFDQEVESSIIKYNRLHSEPKKKVLYTEKIHPALSKLVENVIHKFKFYHYESTYADLKHETVIFLFERLEKFSPDKGKAFSYFTVIARNYLTVKNREMYKHKIEKDDLMAVDEQRNIVNEVVSTEKRDLLSDFLKVWSAWGVDNVEVLFIKDKNRRIAEAIFVIFGSAREIDIFNKKALYVLIREHAKIKTSYITKVVGYLKDLFSEMYGDYLKHGTIDWGNYLLKNSELDVNE